MSTPIPYLLPPSLSLCRLSKDEHEVRFPEILADVTCLHEADVALIGVPFDGGTVSGRAGSRSAPQALRVSLQASRTYEPHLDVDISQEIRVVDAGDVAVLHTDVPATLQRIRTVIRHLLEASVVPVILGGDHLVTFPCLQALADVSPGPVGVINFDSHFDVRASYGGEVSSGTPFRLALERCGGKVRPQNLVEIGPHGFHAQRFYREFIREAGIRLITAQEVHERGIKAVLEDAIFWATEGTDALYVSVDIDALDMAWAPGTNNPTPGGLTGAQILEAMWVLGQLPHTRVLDLVEISPPLDVANLTVIMGREIMMNFLGGVALRKKRARGGSPT